MNAHEEIIDLTNDAGFGRLVQIIKEGKLDKLDLSTDIDRLVEKQAYADPIDFADSKNKRFSIATPIETYISARYAEKCAAAVDPVVLDILNDACVMFGVPEVEFAVKTASLDEVEVFPAAVSEEAPIDKYAGCTDYGTEFETCLDARAALFPDHTEEYAEMKKLAGELSAPDMVRLLTLHDESLGANVPWVETRVGTPEYAVFEKRSSFLTIDLGDKTVDFEKLAEYQEQLNDMGIELDFDEHDPYTIKTAIEKLPVSMKRMIASIIA